MTVLHFQINDKFDLDYQKDRGVVYNGINGILRPIWLGIIGGRDDMQVEAQWNDVVRK